MPKKLVMRSHITDVDASSRRMIAAFKKSQLDADEHLSTAFHKLEDLSERLTEAILPNKIVSKLRTRDNRRIKSFRNLYHLVKGLRHHPNEDISRAAADVALLLNKYGLKTSIQSYATKTSWLGSLLYDLSEKKMEPVLLTLPGCIENIKTLQEDQTAFEQARLGHEELKVREKRRDNASLIKNLVMEVINEDIVTYLRAMQRADPGHYSAFTAIIAKIIESNNDTVYLRKIRTTREV